LSVFARFEDNTAPLLISHQEQFPAVTLSFNLAPGVALGDAVVLVESTIRELRMPVTLHGSFQGNGAGLQGDAGQPAYTDRRRVDRRLHRARHTVRKLHPPDHDPVDSAVGRPGRRVLALMLCRLELSVISLIGIILLIGIVKKNAIMMIDFALEAERLQGLDTRASIRTACLLRFRPIMMTTMAAILGGLPLALAPAPGRNCARPWGWRSSVDCWCRRS